MSPSFFGFTSPSVAGWRDGRVCEVLGLGRLVLVPGPAAETRGRGVGTAAPRARIEGSWWLNRGELKLGSRGADAPIEGS
jgi:hypothetical protein